MGKSLKDIDTGERFLNRTAMDCAVRSRIDKWDLMKLQSFCKAKDTVNKKKRPPTDWERIFTYPKSDRGIISNIYKELRKVDFRKSSLSHGNELYFYVHMHTFVYTHIYVHPVYVCLPINLNVWNYTCIIIMNRYTFMFSFIIWTSFHSY